MNLEALAIIGGFTAVLGAVLLTIGLLLARWIKRRRPQANAVRTRITGNGLVLYSIMILCLIGGMASDQLFPGTSFAEWMKSKWSVPIYFVICAVGTGLLEIVLHMLGMPATKKVERDV